MTISSLPIAVRVYPAPAIALDNSPQRKEYQKTGKRSDAMLVFDTETRIDETQRLTFGSYRFVQGGVCREEGLFYGVDLPECDREHLKRYVSKNLAAATDQRLKLLTLAEFLERKIFRATYKGRALLVGFNLPFDLSRLAREHATARGRFAGGFSLGLHSYVNKWGTECEDKFRPRIAIKHLNSKRALKGFIPRRDSDLSDLIPEGSDNGEPVEGYKFRGHFLDLRTLGFALTDQGYSLASACEAFEVEHGKHTVGSHGTINDDYIDYNRRDVLVTEELALKLLAEFDRHPIDLQPTKAYSPASIGKAYLLAMGIVPILERQPNFPKTYLGYAQSAFFGGRTSAHIRKIPVPVVYTDFLSMYPTVNSLMGLWQFVIAKKITVVERCQTEITGLLQKVSVDRLFDPGAWKELTAFVQIVPDGDILPSRSKYSAASNDWQVGLNHLHSNPDRPAALWYALPDVVASVILTGRIPEIIDAFKLEAHGMAPKLKPIRLRETIEVDPRKVDFFKVVIEERKRLAKRTDLTPTEKSRLEKALKVIANSTGYGIYAEMNRQESDKKITASCHGIDPEPFTCMVQHPETPGKFCFPPLASLITSAARLKLALLERCVSDLGGTYAMEDTDSMAIVATNHGGLIHCPGGSHVNGDEPAIKALSWKQVEEIRTRFESLNPYERDAVPGSILKIEDDNFDQRTGKQRQLYCMAISAKRYALFIKDKKKNPALLRRGVNNSTDRWSEHGLGHLLNPTAPESEDRKWIGQAWLNVIRKALKMTAQDLGFEDCPAVGRVTVSSPAVIKPLSKLNENKSYAQQIKPFNFLLTCHVMPFGHPKGADPEHFHLIAPYNNNPTQWLKMKWIDQYTGNTHRITTASDNGSMRAARVKTYGDVLREYEYHPESKSADSNGDVCQRPTVGLLQRRHLSIDLVKYIGKESNHLEDVDAGLVHSEENIYTEYTDGSRDEWQTKILPEVRRLSLSRLTQESGLSRRALLNIRAGRSRPHPKNLGRLTVIARTVLAPVPLLAPHTEGPQRQKGGTPT